MATLSLTAREAIEALRDLVLAPAEARVAGLMRRDPLCGWVEEPRGTVAARIARYDLLALPILDAEGRLIGIVIQDDAMDVAAEATEAFRVGTVPNLDASLREAGVALLYRGRVGRLVALVFGKLLSCAGIAAFEDTIAANLALVFFLPLLIASAGNAGPQAATLTVRALATGDIRLSDWGRLLVREALVAAATLVQVVLVGSLVGLSVPFLLDRLRLDPASASAPLVTSVADVAGVLIYLGIAAALLPGR